jgi:hypothetical protein
VVALSQLIHWVLSRVQPIPWEDDDEDGVKNLGALTALAKQLLWPFSGRVFDYSKAEGITNWPVP